MYDLYQQEKLDADGFASFYDPLIERKKQLDAALPRLQAELDVMRVNNLSAEEVVSQAKNLYTRWREMSDEEKREIVEIITDRITVAKDEITVSLYQDVPCKDMAKRWRKGWFLTPYCHILIKTIRHDSPPWKDDKSAFSKHILQRRLALNLTQEKLAVRLGISVRTVKNWEHGRTLPSLPQWTTFRQALAGRMNSVDTTSS